MQNVQMEVKGTKLVITVDLSQPGSPSASGKSKVIASTKGNVSIGDAAGTKLGLNVYR